MYKSLKFENGDLVFSNLGKLEWVEDIDSIRQTIFFKLNIIKGELLYNDEYGIVDISKIKNLSKYYNDISNNIKDALIDNEKIIDVNILNMVNSNTRGNIDVELEIILTDDTRLNIAYTI